jgi:hypothetical protein
MLKVHKPDLATISNNGIIMAYLFVVRLQGYVLGRLDLRIPP